MVRPERMIMTGYILSASVAIGTPQGEILPDQDAARWAAKAIVKELEWDKMASRFEKKHLKLDKYPELMYIGIIARVASEQRITWRWEF